MEATVNIDPLKSMVDWEHFCLKAVNSGFPVRAIGISN